jgi:hypothetical protein
MTLPGPTAWQPSYRRLCCVSCGKRRQQCHNARQNRLTIPRPYRLLPVPNQPPQGGNSVKKSPKQTGRQPGPDTVRTALLITRVSTTRQAENDEGPLKNQLQRLRGFLDYRRTYDEDWREAGVIELRVSLVKIRSAPPSSSPYSRRFVRLKPTLSSARPWTGSAAASLTS